MELIIGPRTYSTWSLRGWLVMRATGADFSVIDARYDTEAHKAALMRISPSGFVPVLRVDGEVIWDTLAIAEWAAERYPAAKLWPADPTVRALARSAAAEMHSGFTALRTFCGTSPDHPMVGPSRTETPSDPALDRDLARIVLCSARCAAGSKEADPGCSESGRSPTSFTRRSPRASGISRSTCQLTAMTGRRGPTWRRCWRIRISGNGKQRPELDRRQPFRLTPG